MSNRIAAIMRRRAQGRIRGARFRDRQRDNKRNPTRYDGQVAYDGTVLGMLVLRGYILDSDTADKHKVNAALTQLVFDEAYYPTPPHCPRCGQVLTRLL